MLVTSILELSSELYNLERVNQILKCDGKGSSPSQTDSMKVSAWTYKDNDSCSCIYDPDPKEKLLCDESPLMTLSR